MQEKIKKFRKLEKGFFIGGLVSTIVCSVMFIVGLIIFLIGMVDIAQAAQGVTQYTPTQEQAIIVTCGAITYALGIGGISVGVPLIVVSKAVFRTKARNLERQLNNN